MVRDDEFLDEPVFKLYHSETALMRYMKNLERRDISLATSMISLGSCTMKLNAAIEMLPLSWPEFGAIHPLYRFTGRRLSADDPGNGRNVGQSNRFCGV